MKIPTEFTRIAKHFAPLAAAGGLGLTDDAAVISPPPNRDLVITADAMVAGVHFLPEEVPENIARKLLRVNLSDIAAMGAKPLYYLLTVSVPRDVPESWFEAFARGLAADQARYGIGLLGGDSTSTPGPVTVSVTMFGHVAPGAALRRGGAKPGDDLWVTGVIGDGVLGLWALRGERNDPTGSLARRYRFPEPRLGLKLTGMVNAAMDISDGLVQDSGHMARASNAGLVLELAKIPLSPAGHAEGLAFVASGIAGGDDYELLLAVPPVHARAVQAMADEAGVAVTRIGRFDTTPGEVRAVDANGRPIKLGRGGWSHF